MSASTLVYSSYSSTIVPVIETEQEETYGEYLEATQYMEEDEAHCFVCGRHTDHFAEHDDLVEQGVARYGSDGSVYRV